jgi:hypothetical protein
LISPPALWAKSFTISTENISGNQRNYWAFKAGLTGRRTDKTTMDVCDALHGFFQALYHQAVAAVAQGSVEAAVDSPAVVVSNDSDVIDFSDNM